MLSFNQFDNYWNYYLSVEKNLIKTIDYVEVCPQNDATHSIEYAKIIMLACSEIDALCRLLCKAIDPKSDFDDPTTWTGNITEYARIILLKFPKIVSFEFCNSRSGYNIAPFKDWKLTPYTSPAWWRDYQKIKHYRHDSYEYANQVNAFSSVAGLMTLNLYLHCFTNNKDYADPKTPSNLFSFNASSPYLAVRTVMELPDFKGVS